MIEDTASITSGALIEARGLHTYYGASHILHGVDFVVGRGETVALMGRNGMGKTTLLKSVLGLVRPRAGEVRVKGRVMTDAAPVAPVVGTVTKLDAVLEVQLTGSLGSSEPPACDRGAMSVPC